MLYYIIYPLLKLLSFIPLRVLYLLSDGIAWLLRKGVKYRVDLVEQQMRDAFPERSEEVIQEQVKKFYQSFCDQWIETIKSLSWGNKQLFKHIDGDLSMFEEERPTFTFLGHQFNWEWAFVYAAATQEKRFAGMYLPINNKALDKIFLDLRSKTGGKMIPAKQFKEGLQELEKAPFTLNFIADQNPGAIERASWQTFFHREIPFLQAGFRKAQAYEAKVVFISIKKRSRGVYRIHTELIAENAAEMEAEAMVKKYVALLEKSISEQPENWMWTHRRWKYART